MEHSETARRYRHHGEELRAKAELITDPATREHYVKVAEVYDALADSEERMAKDGTAVPEPPRF